MSSFIEITVPEIGDFAEVEIIEILVAEGQPVSAEDSLLTLESDKATMDIPAPHSGVLSKWLVQVGQKVSPGTAIAHLTASEEAAPATLAVNSVDAVDSAGSVGSDQDAAPHTEQTQQKPQPESPANTTRTTTAQSSAEPVEARAADKSLATPNSQPPAESSPSAPLPHASPAVRRLARQLGAQLTQIQGSGAKGRILKQDVKDWVKQQFTAPQSAAGLGGGGLPPLPAIDFSQFGEVELVPLTRIKKISGPHLQRAWLNIPHVTHHDEADITELEEFRQSLKAEAEQQGIRITVLAFVVKTLAKALHKFPSFNASLHADGAQLVLKKYYNIGLAVDTPHGLVVPVLKDVERKSVFALAQEMGELSERARLGKLQAQDLQGGCMSISSLGGIGGCAFTPIVNAPEVAILGLTRARMRACWNGDEFRPRLLLPLDLSYDHRVVDGAEAARFMAYIAQSLGDVRRLAL